MVAMVIISIIATLCCYGLSIAKINIKQDKFLWALLAMTGYALFSYHYHGYSSRELRSLLCASLFLTFFPRHLISRKLLSGLLVTGSICSFATAFYYGQYLNIVRWEWPINAIPQATLSSAISLAALSIAIEAKKLERYSLFFAFIAGTIAVVISESRGLWLAHSIVSILILLVKLRHCLVSKKNAVIILALFVTSCFAVAPVVESRIDATRYEIQQIEQGNFRTSIGQRLEMWMTAPKLVSDNLILGLGGTLHSKFIELEQQGLIPDGIKGDNPPHYHNQYIDRVIKGGFIGLALLLLLIVTPLTSLARRMGTTRYISGSLVLLYSIAGLTDVPFNHGQTILLFTLLLGSLRTQTTKETYD